MEKDNWQEQKPCQNKKMRRHFGSLSFYRQALMIGVPVMLQSLIQSLDSLMDMTVQAA